MTPTQGDGPLAPELGKVAFAIRVTASGSNAPIFTCQDDGLQHQPEWLTDKPQLCSQHSREIPSFEGNLDPKPFVLVFPGGLIDMTPNPPNSLSSHPETEPSFRELSGWQKAQMKEQLETFAGQKLLILVTGDSATWKYATDFRDVFSQSHWKVKGPIAGPKTRCIPMGVDLWAWKNDFANARPHVLAVRKGLEAAGVKGGHFHKCILAGPNALVLWIGVKSPDEVRGDTPACPPEPSPEVDNLASRF